ncbi:MAG: ribosome silencing factor, partial [Peptococcaceae bacterium]|nr:ribosome silencing factor [Peptococcaceae bacterium]
DYFIIASGTSSPHTKALSDFVEEKVEKDLGENILRREGYQGGSWILLDYGTVIVQIFKPEERSYYNLEKLWGDSPEVDTTGMIEE